MSKPRRYLFEACANSIQSAINAEAGGADRVEICQNLDVGGITPSYGLIQLVVQTVKIPVHVLIRPRPGNFIYTDDEFLIMLADIQACHMLGVHGVVVGMLDGNHQVDVPRMAQIMRAAAPLQVTFHRAFDDAIYWRVALEDVISLGCSRVLCAGGGDSVAHHNTDRMAELVALADKRIIILPGGGLTSRGLDKLLRVPGLVEFHGSATRDRYEQSEHNKRSPQLESKETSTQRVRDIVDKLREFEVDLEDQQDPPAYVP